MGASIKKFIDLFSGIGGIRLGLSRRATCVYSCEINKNACITYKANFNEDPYGDITTLDPKTLPPYDILTAGFPCQAFSVAGRRLGFEDTRGTLFFEVARILKETTPEAFLLENVKGLVGHNKGDTFRTIQDVLIDLGYQIHWDILSPHTHANIPQNRERVFIVGFKNPVPFEFPDKMPLTVQWRDLIDENRRDSRFYYNNPDSPSHVKILDKVISKDSIYQYRRYYIRENKTGVCPTLTANMGLGGHNVPLIRDSWGVRKLTPRECANFQGFPQNFALPIIGQGSGDTYLYHQIGNSVCVPLIKKIVAKLFEALEGK
jgi:DNA (cytosine-5)-methyltransferase 1